MRQRLVAAVELIDQDYAEEPFRQFWDHFWNSLTCSYTERIPWPRATTMLRSHGGSGCLAAACASTSRTSTPASVFRAAPPPSPGLSLTPPGSNTTRFKRWGCCVKSRMCRTASGRARLGTIAADAPIG